MLALLSFPFYDEETEHIDSSDLPKVTQPVNVRASNQSRQSGSKICGSSGYPLLWSMLYLFVRHNFDILAWLVPCVLYVDRSCLSVEGGKSLESGTNSSCTCSFSLGQNMPRVYLYIDGLCSSPISSCLVLARLSSTSSFGYRPRLSPLPPGPSPSHAMTGKLYKS